LGVVRLAVCEPMSQKLDPSTGSGGTTGTRRSSNSCFKGETWGSPAQDRLWATWPEIRLAEERTDARGASEKQVRSLRSEWKERKGRAQTGPGIRLGEKRTDAGCRAISRFARCARNGKKERQGHRPGRKFDSPKKERTLAARARSRFARWARNGKKERQGHRPGRIDLRKPCGGWLGWRSSNPCLRDEHGHPA
jgi:hypothetical protein